MHDIDPFGEPSPICSPPSGSPSKTTQCSISKVDGGDLPHQQHSRPAQGSYSHPGRLGESVGESAGRGWAIPGRTWAIPIWAIPGRYLLSPRTGFVTMTQS